MKKAILSLSIVSALLLVGIVIVLVSGRTDETEDVAGGENQAPFNDLPAGGEHGFPSTGELERLLAREGGPTARAQYEAYRVYARYPDHSRPLKATMTDLTEPWRIKNVPLPIAADPRLRSESLLKQAIAALQALGRSEEEIRDELLRGSDRAPRYAFTLNRHTITEGDELEAELRVAGPDGGGLDVTVVSSRLVSDRRFGSLELGAVPYERTDAGRYLFRWKAPSDADKYWGSLNLIVKARIPGIDDEVDIQQSFFSSPAAPARFTGAFSERLVDGSLVIDAEIDVKRECRYALQANLFNADTDEPTHWVSSDETLKVGRRIVSFTFYGKIFRDGGHEGRFQLRHLRGTCENLPFPASWLGDPARLKDIEKAAARDEPPMRYLPFNTLTHTTGAYRLDQFSDREWDSEFKAQRLERLRNLAEL